MPAEYWFPEGCFISEWANTPDDPACSLARARVLPGHTTRWHWLTGTTERYAILSGQGRMELGHPGTTPPIATATAREIMAGDVVLIPAGTPQRITNTGTDDLVFLAVCTPRFTPACYHAEGDAPAG